MAVMKGIFIFKKILLQMNTITETLEEYNILFINLNVSLDILKTTNF